MQLVGKPLGQPLLWEANAVNTLKYGMINLLGGFLFPSLFFYLALCFFVCLFGFFLSEGFFVLSFYRFPRVTLQLTVALFSSESVITYFLIQCLKLIEQETKCFVPNFRVAIKQQK